jgi:hypothetical protein
MLQKVLPFQSVKKIKIKNKKKHSIVANATPKTLPIAD